MDGDFLEAAAVSSLTSAGGVSVLELKEEDVLMPEEGDGGGSAQKRFQMAVVKAAGISRDDQKRLFGAFAAIAFPRMLISRHQFRELMAGAGWTSNQINRLFR